MRLPAHHNSLDAPVYVWDKVHNTSDYSWLLLKRKKLTPKIKEALAKVWENLFDDFMAEFGKSESYKAILDKTKEIILLRCEYGLTNDRFQLTWIALALEELSELKKSIGKSDLMQAKIAVERKNGFQINMQQTSIREFYSYLKNLK